MSPNFKDNQENGLIKKHSCIGSLQVRAEHEREEEGEGKKSAVPLTFSSLLSLSLSLKVCVCECCSYFVVNPTPAPHSARTILSVYVLACMCVHVCLCVHLHVSLCRFLHYQEMVATVVESSGGLFSSTSNARRR